jgi:hypothetical protein
MTDREASCSCGQLRLGCRGEPVRVAICHCLECQRRTGSVFGVQAFFPSERVDPPRGLAKQFVRQADSGRRVTFSFCPECGGTVFWRAEQAPGLIGVAVGAFADPSFAQPDISVWESRKHPWAGAIGDLEIERRE